MALPCIVSGWCIPSLDAERQNIMPLYQAIVDHVPPPTVGESPSFSVRSEILFKRKVRRTSIDILHFLCLYVNVL